MVLAPDVKKYLKSKHQSLSGSGAFFGVDKFYRAVRNENFSITRKQIREFLQSQEYYTVQRQVNRKFKRNRVIAPYKGYLIDIDTAHLVQYNKENQGYSYILGAIDCFSKEAHTIALKTLKSREVVKAIKNVLSEFDKVERIRSDFGSEFKNASVKALFKRLNIIHYFANNKETKANIIERFFKTLKTLLIRYMVSQNTHQWIDRLQNITENYNKSYHNSIKQSPASVTEADEFKIWKLLYDKREKRNLRKKAPKFKFELNDTVRICSSKSAFEREFDEKWTREWFLISDRIMKEDIPLYSLKDTRNEALLGKYYQNELQLIDVTDKSDVYLIEKVVRKTKLKSLVKWVGWGKAWNSWVRNSEIINFLKKNDNNNNK
jgi:hypothetical protein